MKASIRKFKINFPGDIQGLDQIIIKEKVNPSNIIAIINKTVGNGMLNDYTRQFAESSFLNYLNQKHKIPLSEINKKITFISSSGSEGIVTPHGYMICNDNNDSCDLIKIEGNRRGKKYDDYFKKGLVAGIARSRKLLTKEIGKIEQVFIVADTTKKALYNSGINSPEDVEVVFVKSPVINPKEISYSDLYDPRTSISLTRAASALGVGFALGEINKYLLKPEIIGIDMNIFSKKAFTFSGNEIDNCQVIILGNSVKGNQKLYIKSRILKDLMDIESVYTLFRNSDQNDLIATFAKVSIDIHGNLRGKKVPIYYSDFNTDRMIRAVASGILVSVLKDTEIFISGGGEHQGPNGGGILTGIFRRKMD